jgi:hypothetical protein
MKAVTTSCENHLRMFYTEPGRLVLKYGEVGRTLDPERVLAKALG